MGFFKDTLPICPRNQHCSQWARAYMKYCLCSVKDGVSLTLGLLSVISWGVAEVPQIITNYKEKSTEGLSIVFLMTWIIGDLFNLFGCMLEPATLPTQYYMALLYTITTVFLAAQTIYYGHIYHRLKSRSRGQKVPLFHQTETVDEGKHTNSAVAEKRVKPGDGILSSSPIPVSVPVIRRDSSHGRELYYRSARSLTKSHTPTVGSYMAQSHGYERTTFSIPAPHSLEEPLLHGIVSTQSAPPSNTKNLLCVVSAVTFFLNTVGLHLSANNRSMVSEKPAQGVVIRVGRKLLQNNGVLLMIHGVEGSSSIGTFLGWAMAAIYMGGRLPQICLNAYHLFFCSPICYPKASSDSWMTHWHLAKQIRRGNVEGLNPLMFIFALVGNVTYVASILVNSLNWSKIKPNLPWLVDAGGCVLLDCFILIQFIYFHNRKPNAPKIKHDNVTAA